jgi:hypothetical protein
MNTRNRVLLMGAAILIVIIGLAVLNRYHTIGETEATLFPDPVDRTGLRLSYLNRHVEAFREEHHRLPRDLDELVSPDEQIPEGSDTDIRIDGWNRPFVYSLARSSYELRSAGPDGRYGNDDDIVSPRPVN